VREDLDEAREGVGPGFEDVLRARASGKREMTRDETVKAIDIVLLPERLEIDSGAIAFLVGEITILVVDIGEAAAHAGCEVATTEAKNDDGASRHVLAAVIAHAFHNGGRARIANGKPFSRNPVKECLSSGGAIQGNVANDDVAFGSESRLPRRKDDEFSPGKSLADIIVGFTFESEGEAMGKEGTEALTG
jgi:hypothetical protein